MQVLQVNSCKIIITGKTYDLQNDSDEQFTDMKFMFSRYEVKTINKRLVRGRNQSASEGKFMGSITLLIRLQRYWLPCRHSLVRSNTNRKELSLEIGT